MEIIYISELILTEVTTAESTMIEITTTEPTIIEVTSTVKQGKS